MVLIGYCVGEADRLGDPSKEFFETVGKDEAHIEPIAVAASYQEFELVMDGIGADEGHIGIYEMLITDLTRLSIELDSEPPRSPEEILSRMDIPKEEVDRIINWLDNTLEDARSTGSSLGEKIRDKIRGYERKYLARKRRLRKICPRRVPVDISEATTIEAQLKQTWEGGRSWQWDCKIISETHGIASSKEIILVTEDLKHIIKRKEKILELTKIKDINQLDETISQYSK